MVAKRLRHSSSDDIDPISAASELDYEEIEVLPNAEENSMDDAEGNPGAQEADSESVSRRQAKKQLLHERKKHRPNFDLIDSMNRFWGAGKIKCLSKAQRNKRISTVIEMAKGRISEICGKHDMSRVLQACIKYGTVEHRMAIFKEVESMIVDLAKTRYGSHLLVKLLHYGNRKLQQPLVAKLNGEYRSLSLHRQGCTVVNLAWRAVCNAKEKNVILHEFYGREFSIFVNPKGPVPTLGEITCIEKPDKLKRVLHDVRRFLESCVEKGTMTTAIAHRLASDYLQYADHERRIAMIDLLRDSVIELLQTADGVKAVCFMLGYGSSKDRKVMVRSLKGHVVELCYDGDGHMAVVRVFDVVDDTVAVKKIVLKEIEEIIGNIASDACGSKVLLHLLCPRSTRYFTSSDLQLLQSLTVPVKKEDGSIVQETTSKKDDSVRRKESLDGLWKSLAQWASTTGVVGTGYSAGVIVEFVACALGSEKKEDGIRVLNSLLTDWENSIEGCDISAHQLSQPLVQRAAKRLVRIAAAAGATEFVEGLRSLLTDPQHVHSWCSSCAVWILIALAEVDPSTLQALKKLKKIMPKAADLVNAKGLQMLWKILDAK